MPSHAWSAVVGFDCGLPVEPLSFTLKVKETKYSPAQVLPRRRKDQINAARDKRRAEGRPDKVYRRIAGRQLTAEAYRQVRYRLRKQFSELEAVVKTIAA